MRTGTHRRRALGAPARTTAVALALAALAGAGVTAHAVVGQAPDGGTDEHRATRKALRAVVEEAGLPGVAAETWQKGDGWFGEAGYADTATRRERSRADHFRAASITKVFLATVVLQLQQEGRLDLDDTVETWLPGVVRGHDNDGRKITLRQLLNHTSGLNEYTEDPEFQRRTSGAGFPEHRYDTHRPADLVALATRKTPPHAPGTSASYSNTNYVLAGMIVEKVTGRPYAREIERRVLRPLKLRETSFPGQRAGLPRPHPVGYSRLRDKRPDAPVIDATRQNMTWLGAAGEAISTTGDVNTFFHGLLTGKLLRPAALKEMLTTVPAEEEGFAYGLGVESVTLSCGVQVFGKTGRTNGSLSGTAATRDGSHHLTFNINGDWPKDASAYGGVVEAEFCGSDSDSGPGPAPAPDSDSDSDS
ncbi:serine hydrolase domain-containing protein [Streptomyces albiaxialis]|uniref:Serine hydrolase domain-containing protein n=1 Tax=Streptomyces albiaxialis TaxID=329523 RepID=A0ABP5HBV0_9ACTN